MGRLDRIKAVIQICLFSNNVFAFVFFFVVSLHICCFDKFYGFSGILFSDLIFISVLSLSGLISLRNILFSDIFCSSPLIIYFSIVFIYVIL